MLFSLYNTPEDILSIERLLSNFKPFREFPFNIKFSKMYSTWYLQYTVSTPQQIYPTVYCTMYSILEVLYLSN